jgi:hypothetical protein
MLYAIIKQKCYSRIQYETNQVYQQQQQQQL